jgi:ubiquinone/menaquinone biosynthesis C-methylase UbiE
VDAVDSVPEMLRQARDAVSGAGVDDRVRLVQGDAQQLPFGDAAFDLVVALGVLPWVRTPARAVSEIFRVLRPGGHVVLSVDNRHRLTHLVDPWRNPHLAPLAAWMRRATGRPSNGKVVRMHAPAEFDEILRRTGFETLRASTLGFGPFTLAGHRALPEPLASRLNARLQRLADREVPVVRSRGAQYLVFASRTPAPVVDGVP